MMIGLVPSTIYLQAIHNGDSNLITPAPIDDLVALSL